jgi:uncharacterized membrane protein
MLGKGRRDEGSGLERKAMTMFLDLFRSLFGNGRWGRKAVGRGRESLSDFSVMGSEIGWRWTMMVMKMVFMVMIIVMGVVMIMRRMRRISSCSSSGGGGGAGFGTGWRRTFCCCCCSCIEFGCRSSVVLKF